MSWGPLQQFGGPYNGEPKRSNQKSLIRSVQSLLCAGLVAALSAQGSFVATAAKTTAQAKSQPTRATPSAKSVAAKAPAAGKAGGNAKAQPVALKSLSARVAVRGWDEIGSLAWPDTGDSVIARAKDDWVDVFRNPADPNTSLRLIKGRSVAGPVALMAVGAAGDFVRVAIPLRPNGTLGWVRKSDVTLLRSTFRVQIDLSTNIMTVFDRDQVLIRASVATGTGGTPTPSGLFFMKELVPQAPGGALGPYALGLSGFSNVLFSFGGGEGVIAIHGTNAPGKLGARVSHGCVRVDNGTITKMARLLPLGTPIEIFESSKQTKPTRSSSAWLDTLLSNTSTVDVTPAFGTAPASAAESPAPPVALLAEPAGTPNPPASAVSPSTATSAPSAPNSPSLSAATTTKQAFNDDPLGAVTSR